MTNVNRRRREKLGILGGTFNPIHLGHLLIAQDALEQAGLDRVLLIPSATPPHKPNDNLATARHRLSMVKLAIRGDRRLAVDDREIKRGGISYSVDTVTELKRQWPRADFYFIIGTDSLHELPTWKNYQQLIRLCSFLAVARPGYKVKFRQPVGANSARVTIIVGHACDVASREIRMRIAKRQSIRYLVPEAVRKYIAEQKLYQ